MIEAAKQGEAELIIDELLDSILGPSDTADTTDTVNQVDPEQGILYELQASAFGTFRGWVRNRPR